MQVPFEAAQQAFQGMGMPEWQAAGAVELLRMVEEGDDTQLSNDLSAFSRISGKQPTSLNSWLGLNAGLFRSLEIPQPEQAERIEELAPVAKIE